MRTYVLDTTAIIDNPMIIKKLNGKVIIPLTVIKQLDYLKNSDDEKKAKRSRWASRIIDELGEKGDISSGVTINDGRTTVQILSKYENVDGLASDADNRIVGTALKVKNGLDNDVFLVTLDVNMRNVARGYGLKVFQFNNGNKKSNEKPKNLRIFPAEVVKKLYYEYGLRLRVFKSTPSGLLVEVPEMGKRGYNIFINAMVEIEREMKKENKGFLKKVANFFFD